MRSVLLLALCFPAVKLSPNRGEIPSCACNVASQKVENKIVGGTNPGSLGDNTGGFLNAPVQRKDKKQPRNILNKNEKGESVVGVVSSGVSASGNDKPNDNLRERDGGSEVDDEIRLEVAHGDFAGVGDELAAAEDSRIGGDEGGAELHDHVEDVEEVGEGAEDGDDDAEAGVGVEAGGAADGGEEEVERVDEEGEKARHEEHPVPIRNDVAVGVQDLVPP